MVLGSGTAQSSTGPSQAPSALLHSGGQQQGTVGTTWDWAGCAARSGRLSASTATPLAPRRPGEAGRSDLGTSILAAAGAGVREVQRHALVTADGQQQDGGTRPLLLQPACPSPRLSCAEDCSVDAAAGLPTNTAQRILQNPWDF